MFRKTLLVATLSIALGSFGAPVLADIVIRIAPPPPRSEPMPEPRRGYIWAPGHWDWQGSRYVWVRGDWIPARAGYQYAPTRWYERDGRWVQERGRWNRGQGDRDRDGIPNKMDRDRDGDGVSNRRDDRPNNPNRN